VGHKRFRVKVIRTKDLDSPTLTPLEILEGSTAQQDAEAKN
jgi:hypothetical protein